MGLLNTFNGNDRAEYLMHIKNLIEVGISDVQLHDLEFELTIAISGKFGIFRDEVVRIKENYQNIEFTPPSSYDAKVELVDELVEVLLADNMIEDSEVKICKGIAEKLKLNAFVVNDLISIKLNKD